MENAEKSKSADDERNKYKASQINPHEKNCVKNCEIQEQISNLLIENDFKNKTKKKFNIYYVMMNFILTTSRSYIFPNIYIDCLYISISIRMK